MLPSKMKGGFTLAGPPCTPCFKIGVTLTIGIIIVDHSLQNSFTAAKKGKCPTKRILFNFLMNDRANNI